MESDSAKMRNDCAVPVVATPLSVTVIPVGTNENTVETTGDRVPANGVIRTFPVCTCEALPALTIFAEDRGATRYAYEESISTLPRRVSSVGFTRRI